MPLFGSRANNEALKIQNQINSLVEKKQALQRSIYNEINVLNTKTTEVCAEIGSSVYDMYIEDDIQLETLTEKFETISQFKKKIEEKISQSKDIGNRYDEEISLLNNLINKNTSPAPVAPPAQSASPSTCPSCGTPYSKGEDIFCSNCGERLS